MKMGVPQGSVISPILFNFYVKNLEAPSASLNGAYADDNHASFQHVKPAEIASGLSTAAEELSSRAHDLGMMISAEKSTATLFTPWSKEYGRLPEVKVGDAVIPQTNNPTLLGVTFDPTLSYNAHVDGTVRKQNRRVNLFRALGNSSFGHDKECLTSTFKNVFRPISDHAAAIIFPNLSETSFNKMQKPQNKVMRIITGAHTAASEDFLSTETLLLPVKAHQHLLACQELAKALQPSHPSHAVVTQPTPRNHRQKKHTLRSKCFLTIEEFLTDGIVPPGELKSVLKNIHTKIVSQHVDSLAPNRVLGVRPPLINKHEPLLPKPIRTTLAQLRSGHCQRLNDYRHRVGWSDTDICPECDQAPASTSHLFACSAHPTNLSVTDLWEKPYEAAVFLAASFLSFNDFPDPGPPPPPPPQPRMRRRPPPEPPPAASPDASLSLSSLSLPSSPTSSALEDFSSLSLSPE